MANLTLQSVQSTLSSSALVPRSRMARFCVAFGLVVAIWTLVGPRGFSLGYSLALFVLALALLILGYRTFKKHFMWRLRNRAASTTLGSSVPNSNNYAVAHICLLLANVGRK